MPCFLIFKMTGDTNDFINKLSVTNFTASTIPDDFLKDFAHHQKITRKWVRTDAGWELEDASILREWDAEKESGLQDI